MSGAGGRQQPAEVCFTLGHIRYSWRLATGGLQHRCLVHRHCKALSQLCSRQDHTVSGALRQCKQALGMLSTAVPVLEAPLEWLTALCSVCFRLLYSCS